MRIAFKAGLLGAGIVLAALPAFAEEMNNLKLDDMKQIEAEAAKAATPVEPAAPAPVEPVPAEAVPKPAQ